MKHDVLKKVIFAGSVCGAFFIGGVVRGAADADIIDRWAAGDPPDPSHCALCGSGERMRYHAPCVLNLSTGEITELRIYLPHSELVGELAEEQQGGYTSFQFSHGIEITSSIDTQSGAAHVKKSTADLNPALYCHNCRNFLLPMAAEGYVLLDLYDPEGLAAYAMMGDFTHTIRDYHVEVMEEENEYVINISADLLATAAQVGLEPSS